MKNIVVVILLLLSISCLIQVCASLDCSRYKNDTAVLRSLPFRVPINPDDRSIFGTHATTYPNGSAIGLLSLVNETEIPLTIFCLKILAEFSVKNSIFCNEQSSVCQLPSEISRWSKSLSDITIISTRITHLPASFGKLEQLRRLEFSNTSLVTLPNSFSSLTLLNTIRLRSSQLKTLPKSIGMLRSLDTIYLDNNLNLRSIQSLNGQSRLTFISAINCSITSLPMNLPNVFYLVMKNNKLTNLNGLQTIGSQTKTTKIFSFGQNQIRALSSEFSSIDNIISIELDNNQLTNLPSTIFGYESLGFLNIQNNSFSSTILRNIVEKFKITNPNMRLLY